MASPPPLPGSVSPPPAFSAPTAAAAGGARISWLRRPRAAPAGGAWSTTCWTASSGRGSRPWTSRNCSNEVAYLREALARPELQAALSPGPDAGARRVWTERRFCEVVQEPDGPVMRRGAFDRVVLELDGERVTGATIQDYKTDAFAADELEAKVAHYAPQLAVYRSVLCKMKGLALGDVRAQLLFLGPGLVCEVPLDALEAPAAGSPADSGAEAGGAALPEHPRASEQDVPAPGAPAGQGELPF